MGGISVEVGGCQDQMRKDALKRHGVVTPGTALQRFGLTRCTRLGVLAHGGRATPETDQKGEGEEAGRSPPPSGRKGATEPHFPGTFGGDRVGGDTPPAR